jgi:hypothetical protein
VDPNGGKGASYGCGMDPDGRTTSDAAGDSGTAQATYQSTSGAGKSFGND